MKHAEDAEQVAVMRWARMMTHRWPELVLLHHIPNGGRRDAREAQRLQSQGVKAGVPDLCLPVARGCYHGLYVELKAAKGRLSDHQRDWLQQLEEQGYRACVAYGAQEAIAVLEEYLSE